MYLPSLLVLADVCLCLFSGSVDAACFAFKF